MLWVLIRIALLRWDDSNEYPQHTFGGNSNEYPQHIFLWRIDENENYQIPSFSVLLYTTDVSVIQIQIIISLQNILPHFISLINTEELYAEGIFLSIVSWYKFLWYSTDGGWGLRRYFKL